MKHTRQERRSEMASNYREPEHQLIALHGFDEGERWNKEQGIDWISVEDELPESRIQQTFFWVSSKVLVTDGSSIAYTYYCYTLNGDPFTWFELDFIPTHWFPINLPKTD